MSTRGWRVLVDVLQGSRDSFDLLLASLSVAGQLVRWGPGETKGN